MAYIQAHASSISNVDTSVLGPGFSTLDGVPLTNGVSRILLTRQTTKSQNGVWIFNGSAGQLTRPGGDDQYANNTTLDNATIVWVTGGTARGGTVWGIDPGKRVSVGTTDHDLTRVSLPPVQCRAATTENLDLGDTHATIDGVALVGEGDAGSDIVLVKDQTTASQNGLYWANTGGPMARCTEPLTPTRRVLVSEGDRNAHSRYELVTQGPITPDTTPVRFSPQSLVFSVRDFGAIPDYIVGGNPASFTDNLPFFESALAAMKAAGNRAATLVVDGHFYLGGTLHINQTLVLEGTAEAEPGASNPYRSSPGGWLVFPPNTTGIRLHSASFKAPDEESTADKTVLRNLTISSLVLNDELVNMIPDDTSHGVHSTTPFYAENVRVHAFAADGFHLTEDVIVLNGGGGTPDESGIYRCSVADCGRDGFRAHGSDATAVVFENCVANSNRRYGFHDTSRANTYVGCKAEGNGYPRTLPNAEGSKGSEYRSDGTSNTSTFIGCYAEGGVRNKMDGQVNVLGGTFDGSLVSEDSKAFVLQNGVASRAPFAYQNRRARRFIHAKYPAENYAPDAAEGLTVTSQLGGQSGELVEAFSWEIEDFEPKQAPRAPDDTARFHDVTSLVYVDEPGAGYRWWNLRNNSSYREVMRYPTKQSFARHPAPYFVNGLFLGRDDDPGLASLTRYPTGIHFSAWAAGDDPLTNRPTSQAAGLESPQTYELGDVIWNSDPAAGRAMGQVCTTAGTCGSPGLYATTLDAAMVNTKDATLVNVTGFVLNRFVTIEGVTGVFRIDAVNPATSVITLDQTVTAAASGAAVTIVRAAQTFAGAPTTAGTYVVYLDTTLGLHIGQYVTIEGVADVWRIAAVHDDARTIEIDGAAPGNTGPRAVLAFRAPKFATFGGVRGTHKVAVTSTAQDLTSSYETIKLTGTVSADTVITVPSEDGWSARFFDTTARQNGARLTVSAKDRAGATYDLPNGQTQRLYIEYDDDEDKYHVRPEGPAALGPLPYYPGALALTAWWCASYGGTPWTGTASAGTSGDNDAVHNADDPSVGNAVNGLTAAHFDGTEDLSTEDGNDVLFGTSGAFWCLFKATAAPPNASGQDYGDGSLFTDHTNAETTFGVFTDAGPTYKAVACVYSNPSYVRTTAISFSLNEWYLMQVRWNATEIGIRLNDGAWSVTAFSGFTSVTPSAPTIGSSYASDRFIGDILEIGCCAEDISEATFDQILSYAKDRYGGIDLP